MAVVVAAVFLMPLGVTGTAVALPGIAEELGSDAAGLQWAVNAFNVSFAISTIAAGLLTDRVGPKPLFTVGLGILFIGSDLSALAPTLLVLDLARLLAGIGGGAIVASASALLGRLYAPGPERRRAFALFGSTIGLGLALGPTICGGIVTASGWRAVFVTTAVLAGALLCLSFRIRAGRSAAVSEPAATSPDVSVQARRRLAALMVAPLAAAVGFVTMVSYLPTALSAVLGMHPAQIGVFLLPMTVPVLLGPMLAARAIARSDRVTSVGVIYASLGALIVGDLGLLCLSPELSPAWLLLPLLLIGLGYGLPLGLIDGEAVGAAPEHRRGTATGILNAVRTGGAALAVAVYGYAMIVILSARLPGPRAMRAAAGDTRYADEYTDAFRLLVWGMVIVVSAVALVFCWLVHRPRSSAGGAGRRVDDPSDLSSL